VENHLSILLDVNAVQKCEINTTAQEGRSGTRLAYASNAVGKETTQAKKHVPIAEKLR